MKFGVLFSLLLFTAFIAIANSDTWRCTTVLLKGLEIPKNSYVTPGPRASKDEWYQSVEWKKIPYGQVEVFYEVEVLNDDKDWRTIEKIGSDLFAPNINEGGSMANLMRFALGVPRTGDIKKGIVKIDPHLFKAKPCTTIFTDYSWYPSNEYELGIRVSVRETNEDIIKGSLKIP